MAKRCPDYNLNEKDYEILSYFEQADFEIFLRNAEINKDIRNFLEIFILQRDPIIRDCQSYHNYIQSKLIGAVHSISAASDLNKFRLKKYLDFIESITTDKANKINAAN